MTVTEERPEVETTGQYQDGLAGIISPEDLGTYVMSLIGDSYFFNGISPESLGSKIIEMTNHDPLLKKDPSCFFYFKSDQILDMYQHRELDNKRP